MDLETLIGEAKSVGVTWKASADFHLGHVRMGALLKELVSARKMVYAFIGAFLEQEAIYSRAYADLIANERRVAQFLRALCGSDEYLVLLGRDELDSVEFSTYELARQGLINEYNAGLIKDSPTLKHFDFLLTERKKLWSQSTFISRLVALIVEKGPDILLAAAKHAYILESMRLIAERAGAPRIPKLAFIGDFVGTDGNTPMDSACRDLSIYLYESEKKTNAKIFLIDPTKRGKFTHNMVETILKPLNLVAWTEDAEQKARDLAKDQAAIRDLIICLRKHVDRYIHTKQKWEDRQQQIITTLCQAYSSRKLTVFLGAGVSMSCGLPSWDTLCERLTETMVRTQLKQRADIDIPWIEQMARPISVVCAERLEGVSAIVTARHAKSVLGARYLLAIRDALYTPTGEERQLELSDTMRTIAELAPQVGVFVTYNFDDFLERALEEREVRYQSIFKPDQSVEKSAVSIYHPHGYLPAEGAVSPETKIVFSEDEYHKQYGDSTLWSNIAQMEILKTHTCLLLGLSVEDPNLRRLLELSHAEAPSSYHYVVLLHPQTRAPKGMEQAARFIDDVVTEIQEAAYASLGLRVLWLSGSDELPAVLDELVIADIAMKRQLAAP